MKIIECAKTRYATKIFDESKALTPDLALHVKELLQLAPSSVNAQPWHFLIAETPQGKERLAKATEGPFAYNKQKVMDASQVVVFCAKTDLPDDFQNNLTAQEQLDGRFKTDEARGEQHSKRAMYINIHKTVMQDLTAWTTKQTYLNAGYFLLGVAALGLDAVPLEGFDAALLNREFGLTEKGLTSVIIVAVGYRAENDFNAPLPKSRLPLDQIITTV